MKYLFACATEFEMEPARDLLAGRNDVEFFISGVGLLESACSLSCFLAAHSREIKAVINFGVAGAYVGCGAEIPDICLAEKEVLGDFGLCFNERIEPFNPTDMTVRNSFILDEPLLRKSEKILLEQQIPYKIGTFVTVNCASATIERGNFLSRSHQALAENMEGAAIARACQEFALPLVELRCISNMVEDRNIKGWRLSEACDKSALAASSLAGRLFE